MTLKRIYATPDAHEAIRMGAARARLTIVEFMDLMAQKVPEVIQEQKGA